MLKSGFDLNRTLKTEQSMQDKREIGYCVNRLEKTQYFKRFVFFLKFAIVAKQEIKTNQKRVIIKYNYRTSEKTQNRLEDHIKVCIG